MAKETFSSLNIVGYDSKPIKNTLISRGKSTKVALVFPGEGYTCHMPLLYYPTMALLGKGYDVLWVEYSYRNDKFNALSDDKQYEWTSFDADAAYAAAMKRNYKKTVLIGKSRGCAALVHLAEGHPEIRKIVWLTPPLTWKIYPKILEHSMDQFVAIGTADRFYVEDRVEKIAKDASKVLVIKDADHSLEVEGDATLSLRALGQVTEEIREFV